MVINEQDTSKVAEKEERHSALAEDEEKKALAQKHMDMRAFLKEQPTLIGECDERLIMRLIGKIMVYKESIAVEFKAGVKGEVEM